MQHTGKQLIPDMYKELLPISKKKITIAQYGPEKDIKKLFIEKCTHVYTQIASKHA